MNYNLSYNNVLTFLTPIASLSLLVYELYIVHNLAELMNDYISFIFTLSIYIWTVLCILRLNYMSTKMFPNITKHYPQLLFLMTTLFSLCLFNLVKLHTIIVYNSIVFFKLIIGCILVRFTTYWDKNFVFALYSTKMFISDIVAILSTIVYVFIHTPMYVIYFSFIMSTCSQIMLYYYIKNIKYDYISSDDTQACVNNDYYTDNSPV